MQTVEEAGRRSRQEMAEGRIAEVEEIRAEEDSARLLRLHLMVVESRIPEDVAARTRRMTEIIPVADIIRLQRTRSGVQGQRRILTAREHLYVRNRLSRSLRMIYTASRFRRCSL